MANSKTFLGEVAIIHAETPDKDFGAFEDLSNLEPIHKLARESSEYLELMPYQQLGNHVELSLAVYLNPVFAEGRIIAIVGREKFPTDLDSLANIVDTGIKFGEAKKLKEIIRKIAYREDIGDELALGSKKFSAKYNAEQYSMQVKGLELPAYDPRGAQGQGLCYAISNRGGCHLRGGYTIGPEILGSPRMIDKFAAVGKAGHAVRSIRG